MLFQNRSMNKTYLIVVIALVCIAVGESQSVTLPVPQQLVTKLTISIQKLEGHLKYFGTWYENKHEIYKRVIVTKYYLEELTKALSQYNNVVAGGANTVNGDKNIVIGNYNNIDGSNNWVFISAFTGKINGDLLVGEWRIELDKANLILINTRLAISFLNETKNVERKRKYSKNRQFCKWDKWTNPKNERSDRHWRKYGGYNQWKASEQQKTSSWGNWGAWGSGSTSPNTYGTWGGMWRR